MDMTGKTSLLILSSITWLILLLALSCQAKKEGNALPPVTISSDSLIRAATPTKPDSVILPVLDTISIFEQVLKTKHKSYNYENDTIEIKYGYILSKKRKHLFIKLKNEVENSAFFKIYAIKGNAFSLIFSRTIGLRFTNGYCLFDVNNDANKDFVLTWHADNGCSSCPFHDVYLLKSDALHFTEEITFSEPVFYPQKKLVRGKEYGYGATYYKVKWNNNFSTDTLEYIYPPYASTIGADFLSDSTHYNKVDYTKKQKIILLDDLPTEYTTHDKEWEKQKALFKE
jgi:hypothetical protein